MDDRLKRTIERLSTWSDLAQLEANVKARNGDSEEFTVAIKARTDELGLAFVVEKTGIVLSELSDAERKIVRAIGEYVGIKKGKEQMPTALSTKCVGEASLMPLRLRSARRRPPKVIRHLLMQI